MEPTEAQFLVFNALDTLAIILYSFYNPSSGIWYIETLSPILPTSVIVPDGEIVPFEFVQNYD